MPDMSVHPPPTFPPRVLVVHPSGDLYGSDRVTVEVDAPVSDAGSGRGGAYSRFLRYEQSGATPAPP